MGDPISGGGKPDFVTLVYAASDESISSYSAKLQSSTTASGLPTDTGTAVYYPDQDGEAPHAGEPRDAPPPARIRPSSMRSRTHAMPGSNRLNSAVASQRSSKTAHRVVCKNLLRAGISDCAGLEHRRASIASRNAPALRSNTARTNAVIVYRTGSSRTATNSRIFCAADPHVPTRSGRDAPLSSYVRSAIVISILPGNALVFGNTTTPPTRGLAYTCAGDGRIEGITKRDLSDVITTRSFQLSSWPSVTPVQECPLNGQLERRGQVGRRVVVDADVAGHRSRRKSVL